MPSHVTAQVSRNYKSSAQRLFDALINLEVWTHHLADHPERIVRNDPRVGGSWYVKDVREGVEYIADGEYLEIDPPRRIVYTYRMVQFSPEADRVTVEIVPLNSGCQVTLTHEMTIPHDDTLPAVEVEALLAENKDAVEQGWGQGFDLLSAYID